MKELARTDPNALETAQEARVDLERIRARVTASAEAIKADLKFGADWKAWVRKNPWGFVVGAVALGLVLGSRSRE